MGKNVLLLNFIKTYGGGEIEGCSEVGDFLGLCLGRGIKAANKRTDCRGQRAAVQFSMFKV
jgi:hypothetical protein